MCIFYALNDSKINDGLIDERGDWFEIGTKATEGRMQQSETLNSVHYIYIFRPILTKTNIVHAPIF